MLLHSFSPDRRATRPAYSQDQLILMTAAAASKAAASPAQKHGTQGAMQAARQLFEA
jgi:hypothetical protein